jgi:exodeoxyribonuclease VII small subunit
MAKDIDYKVLSAELDEVLGKLQAGEVDVDEAVKLYERGITITGQLEAYLKTAENKVRKVQAEWEKGA